MTGPRQSSRPYFFEMDNEMLKFILESGMIDISYIQEQFKMNKNEKIVKSHPYSIWQGKDGNWYTYIQKPDGGRRLVKKKEEKAVHQVIIDNWNRSNENKFRDRYFIWVERQKACGRSDNTIYKYGTDYARFFSGDPIENMDIRYVSEEQLGLFINRLLERKNVPWRTLKVTFGYINGVFEKAIIDGIVEKNPCKRVDLPIYRKKCVEPRVKTNEERTISKEEKKIIIEKLKKDDKVEKFAVYLTFLVGMRVGELAALRWDDIDYANGTITIQHSEKRNQLTSVLTVGPTKTGKSRIIPLTDDIKKVLDMTRDYEVKKGTYGEFVFMDENGRVPATKISYEIRGKTLNKEFSSPKSIHSIRRTLNSNMRCNGVSPTVAAAILGHSERVNEKNYTYDILSMSEKKKILIDASE